MLASPPTLKAGGQVLRPDSPAARSGRPLRRTLLAVLLPLAVLVVYAAWLVWSTAEHLHRADADAGAARAALVAGDPQAARAALQRFSRDASTASRRTGSPVWSLLTALPVVGDDARGVRTVSRAADTVGRGAVPGFVDATADLDALRPSGGSVDVNAVSALQGPVARAHTALAEADGQLRQQSPAGFVGPLRSRYLAAESSVAQATTLLATADRAMDVLPGVLGADGPRNYLLVFQSNAEVRASGGFAGAVGLLTVADGRLTLSKQVTGATLEHAPAPVLPMTSAEQTLFGPHLGVNFVDANLTPDFDRTADLWRAQWKRVYGDDVDGVISVDTVTLSYLLGVLGPVQVDGVRLTADNVVPELLNNVYSRLPDNDAEDAFFRDVASQVFAELTSFDGSIGDLASALRRSVDEHRLLVHDFHPDVQSQVAGTPVAGLMAPAAPDSPQVGVFFADGTLSKLSYYLRTHVEVVSSSCRGDVQQLSGRLTLQSTAPRDVASFLPPNVLGDLPTSSIGDMLVTTYVYGPAGGAVDRLRGEAATFDQASADDGDRPVRATTVLLRPGQTRTMTWTMTTGPGQTGVGHVDVTPGVLPGSSSSTFTSSC